MPRTWRSVSALLKHFVKGGGIDDEYEYTVFLVLADSDDEALSRGEALARKLEYRSQNSDGDEIGVLFERMLDVYPLIDLPGDGAEVFSRFLSESQARAIVGEREERKSPKQRQRPRRDAPPRGKR